MTRCTKESHFKFRGMNFDQVDGVAMGSPLAPTLADAFMSDFENKIMDRLEAMGLKGWNRYVDDTFVLLDNKQCTQIILDELNKQHSNIKSTTELEKKKTIPFLDVIVDRTEKGFKSSIYRKPTFTGVLLN